MAETNFIDYVKICCRSGSGGAGSMHFHRDKFTAKGGPDGGNGPHQPEVADLELHGRRLAPAFALVNSMLDIRRISWTC